MLINTQTTQRLVRAAQLERNIPVIPTGYVYKPLTWINLLL